MHHRLEQIATWVTCYIVILFIAAMLFPAYEHVLGLCGVVLALLALLCSLIVIVSSYFQRD